MTTILGPNWVQLDDGSSVRRTSRNEIQYSESGGRTLAIEAEPGEGLAVYLSQVTTWVDGGHLLASDRLRVAECLNLAFRILGTNVDVV